MRPCIVGTRAQAEQFAAKHFGGERPSLCKGMAKTFALATVADRPATSCCIAASVLAVGAGYPPARITHRNV